MRTRFMVGAVAVLALTVAAPAASADPAKGGPIGFCWTMSQDRPPLPNPICVIIYP